MFCKNCGTKVDEECAFCPNCGAVLQQTGETMAAEPVMSEPVGGTEAFNAANGEPQGKKKRMLPIIIGSVAAIAAVAAVVVVGKNLSGGKDTDKLYYLKDNEIMTADGRKYEPIEIDDDFYGRDYGEPSLSAGYIWPIQYTSDGKYIFYEKNYDDGGCDVYYQKAGDKKAKAQKLDSDIIQYSAISKDKIVYIKGEDSGRLYIASTKDKEKIASDVYSFAVSEDYKYIMWLEWDDDSAKVCVQDTDLKSDKIKIGSATCILDYSPDFSTIVYRKDDSVYVCKNFKDSEKIASDVEEVYVVGVDDSLELYYTKSEEGELSAYDLFEDDCAAADAKIVEPEIEDYQTVTYQDSFWGRREVVETDDAYYDAYDAYEDKISRDYLRDALKNETLELGNITVYYYTEKAGEAVEVASFAGETMGTVFGGGEEVPVLCYRELDMENVDKPKMSECMEMFEYELIEQLENAMADGLSTKMLVGESVRKLEGIEEKDISNMFMYLNQKTDEIYIVACKDKLDENGDYVDYVEELYSYPYKNAEAVCELLTDEFYSVECNVEAGIYYLCDVDDESYSGDLYLNGEQIDSDVTPYSMEVDGNKAAYLKDAEYNSEGTLYLYQNGKSKEISEDVPSEGYRFVENGKIAYLTDYNFKRSHGDLKIYNGSKSVDVDSDVTCIFYAMQGPSVGYVY